MQERRSQSRRTTVWQKRNTQLEGDEASLHSEEPSVDVSEDDVALLVDLAQEEGEAQGSSIGPMRNKRVRHQTRCYQSQEEEEKDRAQRANKDKEAREQEHQVEEQASGSPHEEKSHDWKEGARLGEADHPGPHQHTLLPQWAQPWVPGIVPKTWHVFSRFSRFFTFFEGLGFLAWKHVFSRFFTFFTFFHVFGTFWVFGLEARFFTFFHVFGNPI